LRGGGRIKKNRVDSGVKSEGAKSGGGSKLLYCQGGRGNLGHGMKVYLLRRGLGEPGGPTRRMLGLEIGPPDLEKTREGNKKKGRFSWEKGTEI